MNTLISADYTIDFNMKSFKNGFVTYTNGKTTFLNRPIENKKIVKFRNSVIIPPFINTHTHLELSLTSFNPQKCKSFTDWLLFIMENRQKLDIGTIKKSINLGVKLSRKWGTLFHGDISSFGISKKLLKNSVVFSEIIGNKLPEKTDFPLSIHAIYSTSFNLIRKCATLAREKESLYQMHIGESEEETKFVRGEKNLFEEKIYKKIGRKRFENIYARNIVEYLKKADAISPYLIAVHCTNLSRKELETLMENRTRIALCPRSNLFLKAGFPDIKFLIDYELTSIGTDGLSSNTSLSMISEIKTIYTKLDGGISLKKLLKLSTVNGAKVLNKYNDYVSSGVIAVITAEKPFSDPFEVLLMDDIEVKLIDLKSQKVLNYSDTDMN